MAVVGERIPGCDGTGTQADPYIFSNEIGFMAAIAVEGCYMEASTSGLTFDSNNGVILAPLYFKCAYMNAKNLTILNLTANQISEPIITLPDNYDRTIENLNIYNFCYVVYEDNATIKSYIIYTDWSVYGGTSKKAIFNNCNFAGIAIGHSSSANLFGKRNWSNHDWSILDIEFNNCTFNVHISEPNYNQFNECSIFCGNNHNPMVLNNCTVCLSGDAPKKRVMITTGYSTYYYTKFNTVTITNSQSNPLSCYQFYAVTKQMGYNYYKLYVTTQNTGNEANIIITDPLALINESRLTVPIGTKALTGIVMQETDPSLDTYIYDNTNLENKGFFVGRVIT